MNHNYKGGEAVKVKDFDWMRKIEPGMVNRILRVHSVISQDSITLEDPSTHAVPNIFFSNKDLIYLGSWNLRSRIKAYLGKKIYECMEYYKYFGE